MPLFAQQAFAERRKWEGVRHPWESQNTCRNYKH